MKKFGLSLCLLLILSACSDDHPRAGYARGPEPTQDIQGETILTPEEFELNLLGTLIKENKIEGGLAGIEKYINAEGNPINFVDLDKDQKIDWVKVTEERQGSTVVLEFIACKSSDPNNAQNQVPVGTIKVRQEGQQIHLEGGYPNYVAGHQNHYFHTTVHHGHGHGLSLGEAFLLAHILSPRPVFMSPMVAPMAYRPMVSPATRMQTRTAFQNQTRVAPIPKKTAPSSFSQGSHATKQASRFAESRAARKATGTTMNSRAGQSSSFNRTPVPQTTAPRNPAPRANNPSKSSWGGSKKTSWGGSRSSGGGRRR